MKQQRRRHYNHQLRPARKQLLLMPHNLPLKQRCHDTTALSCTLLEQHLPSQTHGLHWAAMLLKPQAVTLLMHMAMVM
jgi:hypothetical protein